MARAEFVLYGAVMDNHPRLRDFHKTHVTVICRKCDRVGRYSIQSLIEKHGPDYRFLDLRHELEKTCRRGPTLESVNQVCGIAMPEMLELAKIRNPDFKY